MTVRGANYERRLLDYYPTPAETTRVILQHVRFAPRLCDPCCGPTMRMMRVFSQFGYDACGSDFYYGYNFLIDSFRWPDADICTNPPYGGKSGKLAVAFVHRAIRVAHRKVAMLLPVDFDSGDTRRSIFGECPQLSLKIVLTNRIRWFAGKAGSLNHAIFVWDKQHKGRPSLIYAKQVYDAPRVR